MDKFWSSQNRLYYRNLKTCTDFEDRAILGCTTVAANAVRLLAREKTNGKFMEIWTTALGWKIIHSNSRHMFKSKKQLWTFFKFHLGSKHFRLKKHVLRRLRCHVFRHFAAMAVFFHDEMPRWLDDHKIHCKVPQKYTIKHIKKKKKTIYQYIYIYQYQLQAIVHYSHRFTVKNEVAPSGEL